MLGEHNKELAKFCVDFAIKNRADYADARIIKSDEESYMLKNGTPESAVFSESIGIGFRVLVNGGMSFLSINNLHKETIKKRILESIKSAKVAGKKNKNKIKLSEEKTYKDKWKIDEKIKLMDVSPEEKMKYLIDIEKSLSHLKKNLISRFFRLLSGTTEKFYVNNEGTEISSYIPQIFMFYSLIAVNGKDSEQRYYPVGESGGWEIIKKWNINDKIKNDAEMLVKILKEAKPAKKEMQDIILSPELVGIAMHESCGHPGEADRTLGREAAQAGETYVTPQLIGTRIGNNVVTVVDDPTVENSFGFYKYDDEGVPAQRRMLIKNGTLNGFLHNRETASVFGVKSNGASRASDYNRESIVRMSTTFMLPGNHSFEELLEDVKYGIFIKTYNEWNIDDKRYNAKYTGGETYRIENGELKGLLRAPKLEIQTPTFYSSIDALSKKVEFISGTCGKNEPMDGVPVWMGGPYARLRKIPIGS